MTIPIENVIAAFPRSIKTGNITLHPLSIGDAIRLAERGIDVTKTPIPKEYLFFTAFVLSKEKDFKRFLRRAKCGLKALANAVEEVVSYGFSTHIPPQQSISAPITFTPSGLGWTLVLLDWLMSEYGLTFTEALTIPLCSIFALQAAARIRHGEKHGGPDYIERTLDIVKNSTH